MPGLSSRRRAVVLAGLWMAVLAGCSVPPLQEPVAPINPPPPGHRPAAPAPAYWIATPFDEAEFAPYAQPGNSIINGEAFWRAPDGRTLLARRREVVLVPDTAYTRELVEPSRSGRYSRVANFDRRYFRYRRTATTDERGHFRFTGLPAGSYILQTSVTVSNPGRYGLANGSVYLRQQVTVGPDAAVYAVLSRQ